MRGCRSEVVCRFHLKTGKQPRVIFKRKGAERMPLHNDMGEGELVKKRRGIHGGGLRGVTKCYP